MIHSKTPRKSLLLLTFIIALAAVSAGCGSGGSTSNTHSDPDALINLDEYPEPPMPTGDFSYNVASLIYDSNILMSDGFLQNILHDALSEPEIGQGFMDATKLIIRNHKDAINDSLITEAWLPIGSNNSQPQQVKIGAESVKLFERILYKHLQEAGVSTDDADKLSSKALKKNYDINPEMIHDLQTTLGEISAAIESTIGILGNACLIAIANVETPLVDEIPVCGAYALASQLGAAAELSKITLSLFPLHLVDIDISAVRTSSCASDGNCYYDLIYTTCPDTDSPEVTNTLSFNIIGTYANNPGDLAGLAVQKAISFAISQLFVSVQENTLKEYFINALSEQILALLESVGVDATSIIPSAQHEYSVPVDKVTINTSQDIISVKKMAYVDRIKIYTVDDNTGHVTATVTAAPFFDDEELISKTKDIDTPRGILGVLSFDYMGSEVNRTYPYYTGNNTTLTFHSTTPYIPQVISCNKQIHIETTGPYGGTWDFNSTCNISTIADNDNDLFNNKKKLSITGYWNGDSGTMDATIDLEDVCGNTLSISQSASW